MGVVSDTKCLPFVFVGGVLGRLVAAAGFLGVVSGETGISGRRDFSERFLEECCCTSEILKRESAMHFTLHNSDWFGRKSLRLHVKPAQVRLITTMKLG